MNRRLDIRADSGGSVKISIYSHNWPKYVSSVWWSLRQGCRWKRGFESSGFL